MWTILVPFREDVPIVGQYHSKWIEVHITNASTTAVTTEKLKLTFSSLGLPEMLVTDNGPSFESRVYRFCES